MTTYRTDPTTLARRVEALEAELARHARDARRDRDGLAAEVARLESENRRLRGEELQLADRAQRKEAWALFGRIALLTAVASGIAGLVALVGGAGHAVWPAAIIGGIGLLALRGLADALIRDS